MRAFRCLLGVAVVVVCLLVVGGGVALALPASFGSGVGEESGQFSEPFGIAADQESGDVYVTDTQNQRVDKFGPAGEFLFAWGWGVADGHTEALQTCTTDCFRGVYGSGGGEMKNPDGVAVDNGPLSASHGDVYVMDSGTDRVEKFDSSGAFLLAFGKEVNATTNGDVCLAGEACRAGTSGTEPGEFQMGETGGIAVDASGDVFVGDVNRVEEFTQGGVYVGQVAIAGAGTVKALAVDASGDVYVQASELAGVHEYEASGAEVGAPRDTTGSFPYGARDFLAVGSAGELFVAESLGGVGVVHIREYDSSGGEVASFDRDPQGEGGQRGIAFNPVAGAVDVLDRERVRVVGVPAAGPLIVNTSGEEVQPTSVAVNGLVNPEGHETSYHVEYGTSASYGSSTTPATLTGGEFEDEPVSIPLSGLQTSTTYHFRVVASNSAGTSFGEDETFVTLPPAVIDSESVSGVTATGATLAGQINPLGRDTSYRFEYGTTTGYGASVPVPDGDVGSGRSDVSVSALVEGLSPSVTYHYRLVASNSLGVVDGPDRVFVTQGGEAPALPDGRAWEMVSPPEKRGWTLEGIGGPGGGGALVQAAADGSAVTYPAAGPIEAGAKGNRNVAWSQVLSSRAAGGWSSLDIATPHETVVGGIFRPSEYLGFSSDLSAGLVEPQGGATPLSPQASEHTPYRRETGGVYTPLVDAGNVPPGTRFGQLEESGYIKVGDARFVGASRDMSHVILESLPPLTEGVAAPGVSGTNLFEWAGGSLRLVSVLPNRKAATEEEYNASLGSENLNVRGAVSDDGSRVVWRVNKTGGQEALYLRDVARGETVQLDTVQAGAHGGTSNPQFAVASSDGSKVFFIDGSRLTSDATTGLNLYMCAIVEVAGKLRCQLKDLAVDQNAGEAAEVQGTAIGTGEDGRYVYFAARGVLAAGATRGSCDLSTGVCNLYVYDTVRGEVRRVAQLSSRDYHDWEAFGGAYLQSLTAGVSPDGRYLAFMSERSLTGYDNRDARSGQPDVEVFLYDAGTGRLVCASCNPSGARPSGVFDSGKYPGLLADRPANWEGHWLAGSIPSWTNVDSTSPVSYRSRYLSDSGRLFFDSPDALVPGDANGTGDVYEFEPPKGEGTPASDTCAVGSRGYSAVSGGCVGLISAGSSGEESAFMDASESGDDVFFLTSSRLVPQDLDSSFDVYDARVCTPGSPCVAAPAAGSPPCVTADSCRAAPSSQPGVFGAPPSATFSGAGNPTTAASRPTVKKKAPSVAQQRATALRKCRTKPKRKRASCEAQARRRYQVGVKAKRSARSPHGKRSR
ncbi:MAG TPA: hypothetical protein VIC06_06425 [Solirubrobacteraceae bacterium]